MHQETPTEKGRVRCFRARYSFWHNPLSREVSCPSAKVGALNTWEKKFNDHQDSGLGVFFAYGGRQHMWGFFTLRYSEESTLSIFSLHQTQTRFCRSCGAHIP